MNTDKDNLNTITPKQLKAISLLASGLTCADVSKKIHVTPQTISVWNKSPAFVAQVNKLKQEMLDSTRSRLIKLGSLAIEELEKLLKECPSYETKRRAINDIFQLIGLSDPSSGLYGWGIGPTTAESVEEGWKVKSNLNLNILEGY